MTAAPFIACLILEPFALWSARRGHTGSPVVVVRAGRIVHACRGAVRGGVRRNMPLGAALARVPDLMVVPELPEVLGHAWDTLTADLEAYSPRVESLGPGRALLTLREGAARELAALLGGRVGLSSSREMAQLAALAAHEGEARLVTDAGTADFLRSARIELLRGVGLPEAVVGRLRALGVTRIGELMRWSAAQRQAFLGAEAARLKPFLFGPRSVGVVSARPAPRVVVSLGAGDEPLREPRDVEALLARAAADVLTRLGERGAARVVVRACTALGWLEGGRTVKGGALDARHLTRLATLALGDTGAAALGIERLELVLIGLSPPRRQVGLWPDVRELDAVAALLARFPDALVRAEIHDEHAYASDARYRWVNWRSGEARRPRLHHARPLGGAPDRALASSSRARKDRP